MAETIIEHSKGMVSVTGESNQPSQQVIEKLRGTKLYQSLVERVGEAQAEELIEGRRSQEPVEKPAEDPSLASA